MFLTGTGCFADYLHYIKLTRANKKIKNQIDNIF